MKPVYIHNYFVYGNIHPEQYKTANLLHFLLRRKNIRLQNDSLIMIFFYK